MNRPKDFQTWPPEKQAAYRQKESEYRQRWRAKNRDKVAEQNRRCDSLRRDNPARKAAGMQRLEKFKSAHPKNGRNLKKAAERSRRVREISMKTIDDAWVIKLLKLPAAIAKQVPEVIEAKRQEILLKREISKLK